MARRQVIEIRCDRCERTETQEPSEAALDQSKAEVSVTFHGQSVVYGDLCTRCRKACEGYFKSMTKQVEKEEGEPKKEAPKKGILGLGGRQAG